VTNPFNPLTRDRLSRVVKFLAHHIMSRVGFTYFQPDSWWANLYFDMSIEDVKTCKILCL